MLAWDLDNAVSLRLLTFDNERDEAHAKLTAKMTAHYCVSFFNGEDPDDNATTNGGEFPVGD